MSAKFLGACASVISALGWASGPVVAQGAAPVFYTVILPAGEFGSSIFLRELLAGLSAAQVFCSKLQDKAFMVDCLADRMDRVARDIPEGTQYDEVRAVLRQTSRELSQLAVAHKDPARNRARVAVPNAAGQRSSRALVPVTSQMQTQVNAAAAAILEEAATVLLRSAEAAPQRSGQYTQIAKALASNKLLLRS